MSLIVENMNNTLIGNRTEIVFFDVETTFPTPPDQGRAILEFGSMLVCPRKLVELDTYSSLVKPLDPNHISTLSARRNGITHDAVSSAPSFAELADKVYEILHGRIWAGHNIVRFDCERIKEAFAEIGRPAPEPKGFIDTLPLLTQTFDKRAGDMKMASIANYFGLGQQTHRSLDDVRMNLEVVKCCATVLFLEWSRPDIFTANNWVSPNAITRSCSDHAGFLDPNQVSLNYISASFVPLFCGIQRIQLLHNNVPMQLHCPSLRVCFGLSTKYLDNHGRPRLNIVVDTSPSLCMVLETCDNMAKELYVDSGSSSKWIDVVSVNKGYFGTPTARLQIPTEMNSDETARYGTEIYQKESSGMIDFSKFDPAELEPFFKPGTFVEAFLLLETYDYKQNAGIRLIAKLLNIQG